MEKKTVPRSKTELIEEIESLRRSVSALEKTISEQKQAEESLHLHDMLLRSIADSPSAISIVSTDLEGNVLFWNKGAENLLGHRAEEIVGRQKISVVYPPDDMETKATVQKVVGFILTEKRGTTCEVNEITKDRRSLIVKLTLSPRFDKEGRVVGILGIGENITERKQAEKALAERVRMAAFGSEIGSALVASGSLQVMLQQCVEAVARHIDASLTQIWTLHTGDNVLELQAGFPSGYSDIPHALVKHIAWERKPYLTNSSDPLVNVPPDGKAPSAARSDQVRKGHGNLPPGVFPVSEMENLPGVTSFAGYPLIVEDRLMGVLEIFSKTPITEAEQHTLGIVANEIAIGIERIWAYAVVRASEERIRAIVANALDGIITIYQNSIIESFNPAAETIFGYKAQEVVGKNIGLLIPGPNQNKREHYLQDYIQTGGVIGRVCEIEGVRHNGFSFPMELAISKLQMPERRKQERLREGDKPVLFLAMVRDITERKRFETILREERDYTAQLTEKTPALICGMTPTGIIRFINPAVGENTGYGAGDLIGKNWWRTFYPGDDDKQVERLFEKLEKGVVADYEMLMTTRTGEKRMVAWSFANRFDETGKLVEIIGFGVDLTERKKVENELILAAQKAEESNRLKTSFLSVMSHEFRTPLTVMLGNTPLLTNKDYLPPPEEVSDIARDIEASGEHLLALIDDLLDFSKIEAGKMILTPQKLSVREAILEAVSTVYVMADSKGLVIHTQIEDLTIAADPVRLKQILLNLLSNAIKFTDQGEINVTVRRQEGKACFRVQDTGCGIAENDLSIIFDSFRQADASVTRAASGTGLGLAITKKLVEMHGGDISVQSTLGQGTVVTFVIPFVPPERNDDIDFPSW